MRSVIRLAIVLHGLSLPPVCAAQQGGHARLVRGLVLDAGESVALGDVVVMVLGGQMGHVTTSATGRFAISAPAGPIRLLAARIGFAPETLAVAAGADTATFRLRAAAVALDPIVVAADPGFSAASALAIRDLDIRIRPRETAQELLRLAPGLVIAQHAGGGKAEQIFLRGFDADHGTDVAISVDGVPVNMVSHGHGQGYADLHFLIPEVVERGEVRKGPYDARDGNLATAGAVDFQTRDRIDAASVELRGGSFGTAHATALAPLGAGAGRPGGYLAAAVHTTDGPVVSEQDYRRLNGFGKFTAPVGRETEVVLTGSAFRSEWNASGQIPERAVRSGLISRFGSIDDSEGGSTSRHDLSLGLRSAGGGESGWDVRAYVVKYDFELFSNFTFFLSDSLNGDGIRQADDRWILGLGAGYRAPHRIAGLPGRLSAGVGGRADWSDVRLDGQVRRRRRDQRADARVRERHGFAWLRQDVALGPAVRLQLGLRGDLFRFEVGDRLTGAPSSLPHASGSRSEGVVSPKVSLTVQATPAVALYANAGRGFHSNDARGVILAAPDDIVLPRATGGELGARYSWREGSVAAAAWGLELESELVFVGDEGTTEASGRTRRYGVDLEVRARVLPWLWLDADLNLSRGRFRDEPTGANHVPLAPTVTSTGGLTVRDGGPAGGGLRYRHVGARAAIEDGSVQARGYTVAELFGRWSFERLDLIVALDNVFDVEWNEAQFATTSRLRDEPSPSTELHFTPGPGRALQVGVEYRF